MNRSRIVKGSMLGIILVLLAFKFFVVDFWTVPQNGMFPTSSAGDRFLCRRHPYSDPSAVRRGDIVVFVQTIQDKEYQFIWRVVGLPGDHVRIAGDEVFINDQSLKHEPLRTFPKGSIARETNGTATYEVAYETHPQHPDKPVDLTVPPGQFFMLGDYRSDAEDSRYHGPVAFESIIARKL